jgi:hypothetical protein
MTRLLRLAALCALLAPAVPSAQVVLGARVGLAFPFGSVQDGLKAKDQLARAFPLELAASWRFDPNWEAGLVGGYAVGSVGDVQSKDCSLTGVSCTGHLWRLAARGEWSVREGAWRPFTAGLLGWEWDVAKWEESSSNWEQTAWNGWLVGLEAGVDRLVSPHVELGAFLGFSLGQYRSISVKGEVPGFGSYDGSRGVDSPTVHTLLSLGLRGNFPL